MRCPLLRWQDTVNSSPLEILESIPGMIRAAAHECSIGVKVVSEKKFRSNPKVNHPEDTVRVTEDMVRVTLEMPLRKWKEMKVT